MTVVCCSSGGDGWRRSGGLTSDGRLVIRTTGGDVVTCSTAVDPGLSADNPLCPPF